MGKKVGNTNNNLNKSRLTKDDEFYTLRSDVEDFLNYYGNNEYFKNKKIHLPCDDESSEFYKYLKDNYSTFGIKEIIATSYDTNGGKIITYKEGKEEMTQVKESMSYLEKESQNISLGADIIVSNPPFSNIPEYIPFLVNSSKDFIILTGLNKLSSVGFLEISKNLGSKYYYYNLDSLKFLRPDGSFSNAPSMWLTTLKNNDRVIRKISDSKTSDKPLDLIVNMKSPDGDDVYSCSRVRQLNNTIPGGKYVLAPITVMTYNFYDHFEFVGFTNHSGVFDVLYVDGTLKKRPYIKNKDGSLKELFVRTVLKIKR